MLCIPVLCKTSGISSCHLNFRSFLRQRVGWLGEAKVSCILRYRGAHLILAYIWARPAILTVDMSRGEMFVVLFFFFFFFFLFISSVSSL